MKKLIHLFIVLTLLGCATSSDRQFALSQTLMAYEKSMRWGDFEGLLAFRDNVSESDLSLISSYKNTRISGYQVKRQIQSQNELSLTIDVEISYFKTNDNRISSVADKQMWSYNDDIKRWLINSPLPDFK